MNFWDKYTPQAPAPQVQPVAAPPPWWAPAPIQQPVQETRIVYAGVQQNLPPGQQPIGMFLQQQEYTTQKAQSAKITATCPDCGSGNYLGSPQDPRQMVRCFDCGHNPNFMHSTQGVTATSSKGGVRTSRGQNNAPTALDAMQLGEPGLGQPMNSIVAHI